MVSQFIWIILLSTIFSLLPESVGFLVVSCNTKDFGNGYCRSSTDCPSQSAKADECKDGVCCRDSGISKAKCVEYGKYVFVQEEALSLLATTRRMFHSVSKCVSEVKLVVGGVKAEPMEFPHMASIGYGPQAAIKYECGGSLISESFVLTAAHCKGAPDSGPARWVKLGALDIRDSNENTQIIVIEKVIIHPGFQPPKKYNDIALMKLSQSAKMSGFIRPACLPSAPGPLQKDATATGWGKLNQSDFDGSKSLMKVQLSIFEEAVCSKSYETDDIIDTTSLPLGIQPSQICAGNLQEAKDTCHGDSGGPLQVMLQAPDCMYSILGVTSFGKSCGAITTPAIYTRVFHYLPWIESIVWP